MHSPSQMNGGGVRIDIRKLYGIPESAHIILYIGNICHRKNQKQIVDAYCLLPEEISQNMFILFLGRDLEPNYGLKKYIDSKELNNHLLVLGNIDKELIPSYYSQSNSVALLSISEGFGLSLIEGMHFGLPCVTFTDLDAYNDIFSEESVVGITKREDIKVANSLEYLYRKPWDRIKIIRHSRIFEEDQMARNYINCYKSIRAR